MWSRALPAGRTQGQIHAVIEQPYRVVAPALARPEGWCQILTLQVNIKRCSVDQSRPGAGRVHHPQAARRDRQRAPRRLPLRAHDQERRLPPCRAERPHRTDGTRDYQIVLEAAPLDSRRTFMHMSYAYTLGAVARMAMKSYLAGAGRDKRGFSVDGGERGVVERSAMRYYLAVEAYLESLGAPTKQGLEARLRNWYAAIAHYPQLHEAVGAEEYVEMKHREARPAPSG